MKSKFTAQKKLLSAILIIVFTLPILISCLSIDFPGGKEGLFSDEYLPKSALVKLLESDKYKNITALQKKMSDSTKVQKADFDLKINKLSIDEGLALDGTNSLKGTIHSSAKNQKISFDASILGNKLAGNLFTNEEKMVVELPEILDKYIVVPYDAEGLTEGLQTTLSLEDIAKIETNINAMIAKFTELTKAGIPDEKIATTKGEVEQNGKTVKADVITLEITEKELGGIVTEFLKYIKSDKDMMEMLTPLLFDTLYMSFEEEVTPESIIDNLIEEIAESDVEFKINVEAKYVRAKLVSLDLAITSPDEDDVKIEFDYTENNGINEFAFVITAYDTKTSLTYTEDAKNNVYELKTNIKDDYSDETVVLNLKIVDDFKFVLGFKTSGPDAIDAEITYEFKNVTETSAEFQFKFIVVDMLDIDLNTKVEVLDSYNFEMPSTSAENAYDVTDEFDMEEVMTKLIEEFEWLEDFFGGDISPIPDRIVSFDTISEYNTEGALLESQYDVIFDGNGGFSAMSNSGGMISYDVDNGKIMYFKNDFFNEISITLYHDGQNWYDVDFENSVMKKTEVEDLEFPEVMLFNDYAEFKTSGYAYVDSVKVVYEKYYYDATEKEVFYIFDEQGNALYLYDGITVYDVMIYETTDFSIYDFSGFTIE